MALKRSIDTPTNTFATLNPLENSWFDFSGGNLTVVRNTASDGAWRASTANIQSPSSGIWYYEIFISHNEVMFGFASKDINTSKSEQTQDTQKNSGLIIYEGYGSSSRIRVDSDFKDVSTQVAANSVVGVCVDFINDTCKIYSNGSEINSANISTSAIIGSYIRPIVLSYSGSANGNFYLNFGQNSDFSGNYTPSRIHTDASGYGEFAYEPPAGAMALCTANITPANVISAPYVIDETGNHSISITETKNVEISSKSPYLAQSIASVYTGNTKPSAWFQHSDLAPGTGAFTYEFWFKAIAWDKTWNVILDERNNDSSKGFLFGVRTDGFVSGQPTPYVYSTQADITWTGFAPLVTGRWYHGVIVGDGSGNIHYWQDGVKSSATHTGGYNFVQDLVTIGYDSTSSGAGNEFNGYASDVRISNIARYSSDDTVVVPTAQLDTDENTIFHLDGSTDKSKNKLNINMNNASSFGKTPYSYSPNVRHTEMKSRASQNFKGGSYVFDGNSSSQLRFPTSTDFEFTGDATVEMWIYLNSEVTGNTPLFGYGNDAGTNYFSFHLAGDGPGKLEWYQHGSLGAKESSVSVNVEQWHHLALVRNGNTIKVYNNGVEVTSASYSATFPTGYILRIGSWYNTGNYGPNTHLDGRIADYHITKEAKYTANYFTPPTEPITPTENTVLLLQPWKQAITLGGYKQIDHSQETPRDHFKAVTWTGTESTGPDDANSIAVGHQPDFIWIKSRNAAHSPYMFDTVRGLSSGNWIRSDSTGPQIDGETRQFNITSTGIDLLTGYNVSNNSNTTYVGWFWKAGGAPSANDKAKVDGEEKTITGDDKLDAGSITPTAMSVNTKAGFSIVKYNGLLSDSVASATIPHGMSGCDFCMIKNLDNANGWVVSHSSIAPNVMSLNDPGQAGSTPPVDPTYGQITALDSDTVTITRGSSRGDNVGENISNWRYVMYCWHSVPGYSAFGSYIGNGSADGPFINCGFKPAFVMMRRTGSADWCVFDNARNPYNPLNSELYANDSKVEDTSDNDLNFLSNGFKIVRPATNFNDNDSNHIYMAFADSSVFGELGTKSKKNPISVNPKQGFKAVKYIGNGGTKTFGSSDLSFVPDLIWSKNLKQPYYPNLFDSVRGTHEVLYPGSDHVNSTEATDTITFNGTGFNLASNAGINETEKEHIVWAWKAGGYPEAGFQSNDAMVNGEAALCSDIAAKAGASITPFAMSVNTDTGFSIVKYQGNGTTGDTIPHGLSKAPDLVIHKNLSSTTQWLTWHRYVQDAPYDNGAYYVCLDTNSGRSNNGGNALWPSAPNENVVTIEKNDEFNNSSHNYIMYCWHSVPGYSAFGNFESTSAGVFVYTGFKPALIISKPRDAAGHWSAYDNERQPFNTGSSNVVHPDLPNQEYNSGVYNFEFFSNGFRSFGTGSSFSSGTHIYIAFAEQPYEFATGR